MNDVNLFQKITDKLNINIVILRILSFFINTTIVCHTFCCIFYYVAYSENFAPSTWVYRLNVMNEPVGLNYLRSLYFAFTAYIAVGYGDVTAYSTSILK